MPDPRLPEPADGGYAQFSPGGRVYRRSNLLAWGSEERWFRLTDDNPHGIPIQGEPGVSRA